MVVVVVVVCVCVCVCFIGVWVAGGVFFGGRRRRRKGVLLCWWVAFVTIMGCHGGCCRKANKAARPVLVCVDVCYCLYICVWCSGGLQHLFDLLSCVWVLSHVMLHDAVGGVCILLRWWVSVIILF